MSQQQGTFNFVIQDKNGNPQYIKVQKSQTKSAAKPETVKILAQKPGTISQVVSTSGTIIQGGSQILRAVTIQGKSTRQFVTIPVQTPIQSLIKTEFPVGGNASKPIQLTTKPIIIPQQQQQQQQAQNSPKAFITSVVDANGTRKRPENESVSELFEFNSNTAKRRKTEKGGKGLRHFSMKVCEKVRKKGLTSYNEVADELVSEFTDPKHVPNSVDQQYDQKNIRRRVYDALNVLMAMNIISKEKKEIRWLGLPTTSAQECVSLMNEKKQITERIRSKTQQLNELLLQQILYKSLIQRNYEHEKVKGPPAPNSAIQLPFIVVNSDKKTEIDCSISNDKTEYLFVFNDKFEINDDFEVLKQIGLTYGLENGTISMANLDKVKTLVPKALEKYIDKMVAEGSLTAVNGFEPGAAAGESIFGPDSFISPGPSADVNSTSPEGHESTVDETSDEESNISTDIEIN